MQLATNDYKLKNVISKQTISQDEDKMLDSELSIRERLKYEKMNNSKFNNNNNNYFDDNDLTNVKDIIHINTAKKNLYYLRINKSKEKLKEKELSYKNSMKDINKSSIKDFETEDIITIRKIKVSYYNF